MFLSKFLLQRINKTGIQRMEKLEDYHLNNIDNLNLNVLRTIHLQLFGCGNDWAGVYSTENIDDLKRISDVVDNIKSIDLINLNKEFQIKWLSEYIHDLHACNIFKKGNIVFLNAFLGIIIDRLGYDFNYNCLVDDKKMLSKALNEEDPEMGKLLLQMLIARNTVFEQPTKKLC